MGNRYPRIVVLPVQPLREVMRMSLIDINNLTFYYDGCYDLIFEHASFQMDTNWKLGLVGRNGRGKTTLLKLLAGWYEYKGQITASVEFDYFPYEVQDKSRDTIQVVEEADPNYELWRVCRELALLKVEADVLYRRFDTLSNGEQTKVMLAVLFAGENRFLLIDEPTNHLDMEGRTVLMEYLRRKSGFILVSHDRYVLDGCVDYIVAINRAQIEVMKGNFSVWQKEKERRDHFELAENEKLRQEMNRLNEAVDRTEHWSDTLEKTKKGTRIAGLRPDRGHIGHKAAKMMKHTLVMERRMRDAAEEKKKLLKNIEQVDKLKLFPAHHYKERLVELKDIRIAYQGIPVLEQFDLTVNQGERVVLSGKNGSGKSSLLKLILNELHYEMAEDTKIPYSGRAELASGLIVSYISQDTSWLSGDVRDFAKQHKLPTESFLALLRKLDFSREQFEKKMEDYSGGQKKKVLVAKSLCEQAHLYIWDEPMNFIDIFSRMQITELICAYRPTMLLVEHDRHFITEIEARTVTL